MSAIRLRSNHRYLLALILLLIIIFGATTLLFALKDLVNDVENVVLLRLLKNLPGPRPIVNPVQMYPMYLPNIQEVVHTLVYRKGEPVEAKPINDAYFQINYSNLSSSPCSDQDVFLVFLIRSAVENERRRAKVRTEWANQARLSKQNTTVRYAFLVGTGAFEGVPRQLLDENQAFGDLVFMDFIDSYWNITRKAMGGLRWALEYCSSASFIVGVDDDMSIHVENMLRFIQNPTTYPYFSREVPVSSKGEWGLQGSSHVYAGHTVRYQPVIREPNTPWTLTMDEYPFPKFPPYNSGGMILYSQRTAEEFLVAALYTKELKVDDVYVGIIAAKLGIPTINLNEFVEILRINTKSWSCTLEYPKAEFLIATHIDFELERQRFLTRCGKSAS